MIALRTTRLGIPLLLIEEGTYGLMCSGGTIFPEGPALGSAWNPDLISRIYAAVAEEAQTPRRVVAGSDMAKTTVLA